MNRVRRPKDPSELSAAEWVRQQLIDDIVAGRLRPDEKLSEVRIADRLGCSRTPVREAFRHLGALGLIHFEKNRGGKVVKLERRSMLELYQALAEIAAACAGLAAQQPETLRHVHLAEIRLPVASPAGTGDEQDLFRALVRAAGNSLLTDVAQSIRCRLLPYWRLLEKAADDWARMGAEAQAKVVAAVQAGDGRAARRLTRAYVLMARDLTLKVLPPSALP
ncbi:MAG: GntR family transcriptional regulator [Magnetospirillum sp.]|nr:GntR family transcriptional regulator [Magnetospirillum sp.]